MIDFKVETCCKTRVFFRDSILFNLAGGLSVFEVMNCMFDGHGLLFCVTGEVTRSVYLASPTSCMKHCPLGIIMPVL